MDWIKTKIYTTHEGIEPLTGVLLNLGITGFVVEDSQDFCEFLERETPRWDYVDESLNYLRDCETSLTVYLCDNAQGRELLCAIKGELTRLHTLDSEHAFGRLAAQTENVSEEDWANNWKQYFKPVPVGERLLIKPTWETLNASQAGGRIVLEIDPSASFGTGTHDTTRLCLALLEKTVKGGERLLDMGCGSGILGIAAMLLGADSVTAVDIDENSVRIARENFLANHIDESRLRFLCGDAGQDSALQAAITAQPCSIVVANIVADVILALLPVLFASLAPRGVLLLSGIIEERCEEIKTALMAHNYALTALEQSGGWVAMAVQGAK